MSQPAGKVFPSGLASVLLQPIRYWNWKSAAVAAVVRGVVFVLALLAGRHGGSSGALVEFVYVFATAGLYAAIQQGLLGVSPRWLGRIGIVVVVPVAALAIDCAAHLAAHAPAPGSVTLSVLVFSLLSASFHLHVMENGAMLVGERARSFGADLRAVPRLLASFVAGPILWAASVLRAATSPVALEPGSAE